MKELEKVIDRMVYGTDTEWNMNIHHFDWVPGVGLYGIWRAYEVTGKEEYLKFLVDWADKHLEEAYVKKTVNSTAPALTILELYKKTGDERYGKVCYDIAEYIMKEAPVTVDGGLEHTVTENVDALVNQMWADTLFMVCIFIARMGSMTGEKKYTEFAVNQLLLHQKYLWNEADYLYYHGWNGTQKNHMSGIYWGRANAWIIYSTVEILQAVGEFDGRNQVLSRLEKHVLGLGKWQRKNGLYGTILNDPESYDELSACAGIACGIRRAAEAGYIDRRYLEIADNTYRVLKDYIDEAGNVLQVSTGTPVMETAERYKQVAICPTLYGQGLMALALAESEEQDERKRVLCGSGTL